jgi:hypothetical protein
MIGTRGDEIYRPRVRASIWGLSGVGAGVELLLPVGAVCETDVPEGDAHVGCCCGCWSRRVLGFYLKGKIGDLENAI